MTSVNSPSRPRRSLVFDAAVAAGCVAVDAGFAGYGLLVQRSAAAVPAVIIALCAAQLLADAALLVRRRAPLVVAGAAVVASLPLVAGYTALLGPVVHSSADPWMPSGAPIAAYSVVVYAGNRRAAWGLVGLLALAIVRPWELSVEGITVTLVMAVLPAMLGLYAAARRRLVQALTDRAERAEREQSLLAEQARAEERVRLATEMHDVVSHRVSLMVLQAGALRMTATEAATRTAAEELRCAGSQALEELRDLIGVLRTPSRGDGRRPRSQSADLPDFSGLVAESRSVGVPVEVSEDGSPGRVTTAVARTAYRVVQEALTNVRKHAPGAAARVRLRYGGERTTITIHNETASGEPDPALAGTGSQTGLAGLRQRVELLGGRLLAEPDGQGGFTVEAVLPNHVPTHAGEPS